MIRRFNFTGRRRLAKDDVTLRLVPAADGRLVLVASFALDAYRLPPAARLFVEAHRQTTWQRFDFGTVGAPGPREAAVLDGFGSAQGVRFRVRVVEAEPKGVAPRILAHADGLRVVAPPRGPGGLALLPVDWGEMESHTWALEIDEESGPLLRVSRRLVPDREAFVGSREFVSLVLPSILRRVLERALEHAHGPEGEEEGWGADWLRLVRAWPGVGPPPRREAGEGVTDAEEDWLDEAVEVFARNHAIAGRFEAWWSAGT